MTIEKTMQENDLFRQLGKMLTDIQAIRDGRMKPNGITEKRSQETVVYEAESQESPENNQD